MAKKIDRISFHFNDRCPHRCGFCYMPFDKKGVGELSLWLKILDRVADFDPKLISFAGGDPLVYNNFYKLISVMKKRSLINLITTGFYMQRERYAAISCKIDSICLAFDEVPTGDKIQRYSREDFEKFASVLQYVDSLHEHITINTLVTPANCDQLHNIAEFLIAKNLTRVHWNLYRFWPFDFIKNGPMYLLEDSKFYSLVDNITRTYSGTLDVRGWHPDERKSGYFFVTSLGRVYTVNGENANKYAFIGSIFDDEIFERWIEHNDPEDVRLKFHQIVDREIVGK